MPGTLVHPECPGVDCHGPQPTPYPSPPVGHVPQRHGFNLWVSFPFQKVEFGSGRRLKSLDAVLSTGLPGGSCENFVVQKHLGRRGWVPVQNGSLSPLSGSSLQQLDGSQEEGPGASTLVVGDVRVHLLRITWQDPRRTVPRRGRGQRRGSTPNAGLAKDLAKSPSRPWL